MMTIPGDLLQIALEGELDVIVHGQNCHNDWGMGIVTQIRVIFPEAYVADQVTPKSDPAKLGTISFATVERFGHPITIVNGYTQFNFKASKGVVLAEYDAIRRVFAAVREQFSGKRIGYSKIGAGLAKGDWPIISKIIMEELMGEDHVYVEKRSQDKG
jgi:O-acetyl-ADP-ribose deacetylase (regulator of RNase III)